MVYTIPVMSRLLKKAVFISVLAAMVFSFLSPVAIGYLPSPEAISQSGEGLQPHPDILISREWSFRGRTLTAGPSGFACPFPGGPSPNGGIAGARSDICSPCAAGGINPVAFGHVYLNNSHFRC